MHMGVVSGHKSRLEEKVKIIFLREDGGLQQYSIGGVIACHAEEDVGGFAFLSNALDNVS